MEAMIQIKVVAPMTAKMALALQTSKNETPMITPQQTDLGRRVVYRPPGAGSRYGVISAIYPHRVFVRFDHQH